MLRSVGYILDALGMSISKGYFAQKVKKYQTLKLIKQIKRDCIIEHNLNQSIKSEDFKFYRQCKIA